MEMKMGDTPQPPEQPTLNTMDEVGRKDSLRSNPASSQKTMHVVKLPTETHLYNRLPRTIMDETLQHGYRSDQLSQNDGYVNGLINLNLGQ
jgi:hypothetical protein